MATSHDAVNPGLTEVRVLGFLGKLIKQKFGTNVLHLAVHTPTEILRLIDCQVEGFTAALLEAGDRGIAYRLIDADPQGLSRDELVFPCRRLIIAPIASGKGGFGRILLGIALVATAFLVPGGILGISSMTLGLMGGSLILGGISQLLTRQRKPKESDRLQSNVINGGLDTTTQGQCVPLLAGQWLLEGMPVISFQVDVLKAKD